MLLHQVLELAVTLVQVDRSGMAWPVAVGSSSGNPCHRGVSYDFENEPRSNVPKHLCVDFSWIDALDSMLEYFRWATGTTFDTQVAWVVALRSDGHMSPSFRRQSCWKKALTAQTKSLAVW